MILQILALCEFKDQLVVRADFWQNGFFADFIFRPPDSFADILAGFLLLIFVGKKCPLKSSRKIPGKILQKSSNKNPRHISAEGPDQLVALFRYKGNMKILGKRRREKTGIRMRCLSGPCHIRGEVLKIAIFAWKLKPGFINRVLVAVVFETSKCL